MTKLAYPALLLTALLTGCPGPDDHHSREGGAATAEPDANTGGSPGSGTDRDGGAPAEAGSMGLRDGGGAGTNVQEGGVAAEAGSVRDASLADGGGSSASDLELERQQTDKLKSCGMFEPSADPAEYRIRDEYDRCSARCIVPASCPQLSSAVCDDEESALIACLEACSDTPRDGFRCGDGSRIPHVWLCDLEPDCEGEEDESGCGEFRCTDGEVLPSKSVRCDYIEDCGDGSDERGCMFSCS